MSAAMAPTALPPEWRLDLSDGDLRQISAALDDDVERGLRREPGADLAVLPAWVGLPDRSAYGLALRCGPMAPGWPWGRRGSPSARSAGPSSPARAPRSTAPASSARSPR